MTVVPFVQPDQTGQNGSSYKTTIDNAIYVMARIGAAFAAHQSQNGSPSVPDMTVTVDGGAILTAGGLVTQAQQVTAAFTTAAANPKRGLVYIDQITGTVGIATGAEAASPSYPSLPAGKIPVAGVLITVGMAQITNADLFDLRPVWAAFMADAIVYDPATSGLAATTVQDALDELAAGGQDQVARDIGMTALIAATSTGGVRGAVVSWVASADNFSTKTNATFDTDHYHNAGGFTQISQGAGSTIGDMTGGGGLAAAFDGTTSQGAGASAAKSTNTYAFVGKDFGVGVTKRVAKFVGYPSNGSGGSVGWTNGGTTRIRLYGSNAAPANATDGTLLYDHGSFSDAATTITVAAGITSGDYRYVWLAVLGVTAAYCAELQLFESQSPGDMTLSDDAETINADCELVDVYVLEKAVDTAPTRRIRASIDGGATWATGVLQAPDYAVGDRRLYRYRCDVSAQNVGSPSPRSLKVEYNTLNDGKERNVYRLDAVPLYA